MGDLDQDQDHDHDYDHDHHDHEDHDHDHDDYGDNDVKGQTIAYFVCMNIYQRNPEEI